MFFWIVREGTSQSPARLQTCMYVCLSSRRTLSMYVYMYVWGSWACMSVCLSQTYKICLFRRVSNSSRKTFSIWSPIQFFEICEGGYFQEPSEAPNVYVCMFELQTYPKHVCMSDRPEEVCMYVWGFWACMYVSVKATKSACFGGCQIPYQNLSEFNV